MNFSGQHQYQPNWYDDPQNPNQLRYFDGVQWTQHFAPKNVSLYPTASKGMASINKGMSIFRNVLAGALFLIGLVLIVAQGSYLLGVSSLLLGITFSLLMLPINFKYKRHLDSGGNYAEWFVESFKYWYTYVFVLIAFLLVLIGSVLTFVLSPNGEPDSSLFFVGFVFFFPGTIWTMEISAKIFDLPLGYGR